MNTAFKRVLGDICPEAESLNEETVKKLHDNLVTLFCKTGMVNSIVSGLPFDADHGYLPWYTYPAIDYLNQLDFSNCRVVEFGCGHSTLYWSMRAESVLSIERDSFWYSKTLNSIKQDNVELVLLQEDNVYFDYVDKLPDSRYDVVIIDGRNRFDTAEKVHKCLRDGGFLIFDNSDWYPRSCSHLRSNGYTQIDFSGFGPFNNYTWCTSVFFRTPITIPHNEHLEFIGKLDVIKEDDNPA